MDTTLNLCLRTLRLIETEEDEDEEEDPMAAFLAGLSPEERADYDALDEVEEPEAMLATPMPAPSDEEAPSPSPRHGWPGQAGPRQEGEERPPHRSSAAQAKGEETGLSTAPPKLTQAEGIGLPAPHPLPPGLTGGPTRRARAADAAARSTAPAPTPRTPAFIPAPEPVPSWLRQRLTDRAPQGP
jgi:hypothetical protein